MMAGVAIMPWRYMPFNRSRINMCRLEIKRAVRTFINMCVNHAMFRGGGGGLVNAQAPP